MTPKPSNFVDFYAVFDPSFGPDTPIAEIKAVYHEKLLSYHPDKRQTNTGFGTRQTQALTEAWAAVRSAEQRAEYDVRWRRWKGVQLPEASSPTKTQVDPNASAMLADVIAEGKKKEGNALYQEAQAIVRKEGMREAAACKFEAALSKYSEGMRLAPANHQLRSNRALCHSALGDWAQCRADANKVTQLRPDFMKGWFLLVKATWKEDSAAAALRDLQRGLAVLPECPELLALKAELLQAESASSPGRAPSQNVTPCASRGTTPRGSRSRDSTPEPSSSRAASKDTVDSARRSPSLRTSAMTSAMSGQRSKPVSPEHLPPISRPRPPAMSHSSSETVLPAALRAAEQQRTAQDADKLDMSMRSNLTRAESVGSVASIGSTSSSPVRQASQQSQNRASQFWRPSDEKRAAALGVSLRFSAGMAEMAAGERSPQPPTVARDSEPCPVPPNIPKGAWSQRKPPTEPASRSCVKNLRAALARVASVWSSDSGPAAVRGQQTVPLGSLHG